MSNDWFTDDKYQNESGWGDNNNFSNDNVSEWAEEGDNVSCWQDNADRDTISEWLVDEEGEGRGEIVQESVKRSTFYEVYKFNINSIFNGPKLFHQEHANKKRRDVK